MQVGILGILIKSVFALLSYLTCHTTWDKIMAVIQKYLFYIPIIQKSKVIC